jgi:Putative zinc-finger
MSGCHRMESGEIDLYFYGELEAGERASIEHHLASCAECRGELEDLAVIRSALASRPAVAGPPAGDWSGFMRRLDEAIEIEQRVKRAATSEGAALLPARARQPWGAPTRLAIAALLTLAATSAAYVAYSVSRGSARPETQAVSSPPAPAASPVLQPASLGADPTGPEKAFAALSEQHFERSKLVVLGLANKDPRRVSRADWEYERQLASSLLSDTRLYRMAAEDRGMKTIANVMSDLELVLLQTSLAETSGREDLEQIQRLIHKRDLVTKMDVAASF